MTIRVSVAQHKQMHEVNMNKAGVLFLIKKLTETPTIHSTTVLYTQMPINLLSFRAGMVTYKFIKQKWHILNNKYCKCFLFYFITLTLHSLLVTFSCLIGEFTRYLVLLVIYSILHAQHGGSFLSLLLFRLFMCGGV